MTNQTTEAPYTTGYTTSADSTTIGYRQMGHGPALILVHGAMQASQNFMKLAAALSDAYTVYVMDRRGRGLSGPFGSDYCMKKAVDDIDALLRATGAHYVFGLSAGALISLQAALMLPAIHKLAIYEPPLPIDSRQSPTAWAPRYERELAQGNLGAAMVSVLKGTVDRNLFTALPRPLLTRFMNMALRGESHEVQGNDVPLDLLIPTLHYDIQVVNEMTGTLDTFRSISAEVLLLGGDKSLAYLKLALDRLETVLPQVRRVEFNGVGHLAADNGGQPERVARELRKFFND